MGRGGGNDRGLYYHPIGNPGVASLLLLLPQLALSVLLYPVIARGVARLDSFRLVRYRVFG